MPLGSQETQRCPLSGHWSSESLTAVFKAEDTVHPLQVSQFPAGGLPHQTQNSLQPNPTLGQLCDSNLPLVCLQWLPPLEILSSVFFSLRIQIISLNKPRLSEAKDETGSCLVDAWQFLLLTCNPKVPELREHKCLTTLW